MSIGAAVTFSAWGMRVGAVFETRALKYYAGHLADTVKSVNARPIIYVIKDYLSAFKLFEWCFLEPTSYRS